MKVNNYLISLAKTLIFTVILPILCSFTHEEDHQTEAREKIDGNVLYGIKQCDLHNYFSSALSGDITQLKGGKKLSKADIEDAKSKVWDIWVNTVLGHYIEKLPSPTSHSDVEKWFHISGPDGMWKLPEGPMPFLYVSKGEAPETGYPLFLFIHGSGPDPEIEWRASMSWAQIFKDTPSVFFIPQSPRGGTGCRWYQPSRQAKWEQLIKLAIASGEINPDKIYFMGISEGAYGSQRLASFYADYLAGAGPIAGGEVLVSCPPENLANVPFTLQTGENDTMYGRKLLTQKVGTLLDSLETLHPGHYVHNVSLQPGKGHGCDYTLTTPWLVNFTRNATPRYFYMENAALGGINNEPLRYRDAFYNVRILEPSDARDNDMYRTAYEMTVNGNTIDLIVNNVSLSTSEPASDSGWTVNLSVDKNFTPATTGKVRIYLNNDIVDMSRPVVVRVNGNKKFKGKVTPKTAVIAESCALFGDPSRLFTAAVDVDIR